MKTKRNVNVEHARKRFNKALLKNKGWRTAVELNLVPQNFKNDVDQKKGQVVLNIAEENINVFEKISGSNEQQIAQKKKDLAIREREIRESRDLQLAQLKSDHQKLLSDARKNYQKNKSDVKISVDRQLLEIRRQRAELQNSETAKKNAKQKMTQSHDSLGSQTKFLDYLIEAVFLQTGDVKLRDAIRAGDAEMLKRLAKERGEK
jgi:putative cell wall-binding protein